MEVAAGAGTGPSGKLENGKMDNYPKELDAGALFVLKSRGTWLHCGYHLATSIVCPSLLSLPFALSLLGWAAGTTWLVLAGMVTFYSFNLLSLVLEQQANLGHRQLRFRDMGTDILGPRWGKYYVGPLQFLICYCSVVATAVLGGQTLKTIYLLARPDGTMQLYQFIIIFGLVILFLAQIPSFHSLRHINLVSLVLCLVYCVCTTVGSIYIGRSKNAPIKDYSLQGTREDRILSAFNGISIIATIYGSGIIPEIQATIAPPIKGKMFKGLIVCYLVIITTYFSVAISGYWAFGNQAKSVILSNFIGKDSNGRDLLPTWFLLLTNASTIAQIIAITLVES
ncbi:hypothetical protein CRG98_015902 [Punica granatum]|uniref:Amino acid transporter transmembrane domain-containing protein n=1 Tax=Punica granatum TaxID=22663 RepID=A0A2I0K5A6_PUNGR|nr:hypothetical protein CRG98_015902 [Punica granatum]